MKRVISVFLSILVAINFGIAQETVFSGVKFGVTSGVAKDLSGAIRWAGASSTRPQPPRVNDSLKSTNCSGERWTGGRGSRWWVFALLRPISLSPVIKSANCFRRYV
jgi:hypothetical protein